MQSLNRMRSKGAIFSGCPDMVSGLKSLLKRSLSPHLSLGLLGMATGAEHLQIALIITARQSLGSYVVNMGLLQ